MSALNNNESNDSCFGVCGHPSAADSRPIHERHHSDGLEIDARQKKQELDALLGQAMDRLSLEEQRTQQNILDGTDETVENAALLDLALQDLDEQLKSVKHNSMYEVAERINPEYVNARAFRVMFLRANEYNAKASADQMLGFFESKYRLFGIEKLVEDIKLADLSEDDIKCLRSGSIQLAGKDRSGRQVIVQFVGAVENLQSWLRVMYFVIMSALEDEDTQLRGIVRIIWWAPTGRKPGAKSKNSRESIKVGRTLPQKKQAMHFCFDDVRQYVLCNVFVKSSNMRARMRVHYGSQLECQYQLSTFGIRPQSIPLDGHGRLDLDRHLHWIQSISMRDKFDRSLICNAAAKGTTNPTQNDVLFTGSKLVNQRGNQRFRSLIQNYAQAYDNERRDATKRQIVAAVIENIHESGGRFLERQHTDAGSTWEEVVPKKLRQKVMQTFRNRRLKADAARRRAEESSSRTLITGEPLPNDVVFGRVQRNPGTELMRRLVVEHFEEYESLGRGLKIGVVDTIMQNIEDRGGRFLQPAEDLEDRWLEVSREIVRDRISKYFRNQRRMRKKN